jgi:D-alanyl-D-alanine carboxypeptidase (penicillin-binding protein 5/6)
MPKKPHRKSHPREKSKPIKASGHKLHIPQRFYPFIVAAILLLVFLIPILIGLFSFTPTYSASIPEPSATPIPSPTVKPIIKPFSSPPNLTSKSAYVLDRDSGTVIYSLNADEEVFPASTTKIMTAMVAMNTYKLDQIITIYEEDASLGQTMKLKKGELISVKNLLYGTLVTSGNDAALALALSYPDGGYTGFVKAMNQKALDLSLTHTQYKNVSGLDVVGHFTSAKDLATLANFALKNDLFRQIVATRTINVSSQDSKIKHHLTTTNQLLWKIPDLTGVKTGWTDGAGECLVATITRQGHQIITVVLGSQDRFADTQNLIDWTYNNFVWKLPKAQ